MPQTLNLLKKLQERVDEAAIDEKVSGDKDDIRKAFKNKDADAIERIFANGLRDDTKADTVQS